MRHGLPVVDGRGCRYGAFSIVTLGPLLHAGWYLWLAPTAIALTTAYYKRKFRPAPRAANA